ncbi:MAG: hypothetical protein Q7J32_03040 [Sphingomonadaceae bacterium]|nr:hypothetical protein [Sphingomonadaceae bacterium]
MTSLRARLAGIERHKLFFGAFSLVVTTIVVVGFLLENRWGYMKPDPMLIYVSNWKEGRTRDEAKVAQAEDVAERTRAYYAQQAEFAKAEAAWKAKQAKDRAD